MRGVEANPMTLTNGGSFTDKVNFICRSPTLLRGTYKQSEYGREIYLALRDSDG
jgi:hypothetical protein